MPLHISVIQAERKLVDIAGKVLVAGVMVDAVQAALFAKLCARIIIEF
jgi:spore germination cell wall hydrolase CwlJ-like protein